MIGFIVRLGSKEEEEGDFFWGGRGGVGCFCFVFGIFLFFIFYFFGPFFFAFYLAITKTKKLMVYISY